MMKLDIVALVIGLLGIAFQLYRELSKSKLEKRLLKAQARKEEAEGDALSLDFLTRIKGEITEELQKKITALEDRVRTLEIEKEQDRKLISANNRLISLLKYILSKTKDCPFNNVEHPCVCDKEYNSLIGNEQ